MPVDYPPDPSHGLGLSRIFDRWLAFEDPHVEAVREAAEATLSQEGGALVYQKFDSYSGMYDHYQWTLATAAKRTPDAKRTLTAAAAVKPIGVLLRHEVCKHRPVLPERRNRRAERIQAAIRAAGASWVRHSRLMGDHRSPMSAVSRSQGQRGNAALAALAELEPAIEDGLRAREGQFLMPPVLSTAACLDDVNTYQAMLAIREVVAQLATPNVPAWRPKGVAVCASCFAVFAPSRRRTASFCKHCSPLTAARRPALALGQEPIQSPGDRATFRKPVFRSEGSYSVVGWSRVTVGICSECGEPFCADRASAKTCTDKCRMRRCRRRKDALGG